MSKLSLRNLNKIYDNNVQAVFDFNLEIEDKEFIVLVGPSGCGKSTTLRMIAGLEEITSGELYIEGRLVNDVQPKDRDIAMVFQSYALYPHMTVYDNMAFGLKLKKVPKDELNRRVTEAARILEMEEYLKRKPKALSGGQRQRVALGRAIVRNAKVFLMDEPLSNLDAKLRVQMRSEIIKLHDRIGTTTVYVTHDQTEAMTMADRIVIMNQGYIQQVGSPINVYDKPENIFVASFIGSPAMNLIYGTYRDGKFHIEDQAFEVSAMHKKDLEAHNNKEVVLGIRPENIHYKGVAEHTFPETPFDFYVEVRELLGQEFILHGDFFGQKILAKVPSHANVEMHDTVQLSFDAERIHFFDKETEVAITK